MKETARTVWLPRIRELFWAVGDAVARPSSSWRVLPDYLIIGAQRCGTTSLQRLLAAHPDVRPPRMRKGVHYFDTAFGRGESWYRSQFPIGLRMQRGAHNSGRPVVTGEASPYYLFHPLVPSRIGELLPDAKLIMLLRDPIERAISHYKHEVRRGFENLSLEDAIAAEPERLEGEVQRMLGDARYNSFPHQHHSYVARGRYAEQISRYLQTFPEKNLLVVESELFWEDPNSTLASVTSFLGISDWTPKTFPHENASSPTVVAPVTRSRLREEFAEPNRRLVELLGRTFRWT